MEDLSREELEKELIHSIEMLGGMFDTESEESNKLYKEIFNGLDFDKDYRTVILFQELKQLSVFAMSFINYVEGKYDNVSYTSSVSKFKVIIDNSNTHRGVIEFDLVYLKKDNFERIHGTSYNQVIFKDNYDANQLKLLTLSREKDIEFTFIK